MRLYLVDGSGFIFRAFHALPPLTRKSDGLPIGAVSGFCNMLWRLLLEMKSQPDAPTHLAVIFDAGSKTFRNEIYPEYKHPKKKWRLKTGATPQWYKARSGTRTKAQSGAARVARFRPPKMR